MKPSVRYRLHRGPYRTPRFRYGSRVECQMRGTVVIVGITDGPIPWPLAREPGRGACGPVVYRDLVRALRHESGVAICHWWGVTSQTVTKWRKALGLSAATTGKRALQ